MKKILSVLLAVLMMVLPVCSMAEAADTAALLPQTQAGFAQKYLAEGQRMVTDVEIEPGAMLLSAVPQELQTAIQELLAALKIEVSAQSIDDMGQGTLRLLLNDTPAADVTIAKEAEQLYVASSFLGDKTIAITKEQLAELLKSQGSIPEDQINALLSGIFGGAVDSQNMIESMIGTPDMQALLAAIAELLNTEPQVEEVTEIPEGVKIDAKTVTTIQLTKEGLKKVTTELAKVLWSMPVVQQMAGNVQNGEPLTEESLTAKLNAIPDVLAEDLAVKVYMNETQSQIQIITEPKVGTGEQVVPVFFSAVIEQKDSNTVMDLTLKATKGEQDSFEMNETVDVTTTEAGGEMKAKVTANITKNGEAFQPIDGDFSATWTNGETSRQMEMNIVETVKPDGSANPVTVSFKISVDDQDLGDHAEQTMTMQAAVAGADLMTLKVKAYTDLGEAYIVTPDAVQPMAMSQEEQQALLQEITQSASMGLVQLLGKLPESVQTLVMQMTSGGSAQQ